MALLKKCAILNFQSAKIVEVIESIHQSMSISKEDTHLLQFTRQDSDGSSKYHTVLDMACNSESQDRVKTSSKSSTSLPTIVRSSSRFEKAMFITPPLRHDRPVQHRGLIASASPSLEFLTFRRSHSVHIRKCQHLVQRLSSILIAQMLILMVCVPFGLSFFPSEWKEIPIPRAIGIQLFLLTTIICQLIFTCTSFPWMTR